MSCINLVFVNRKPPGCVIICHCLAYVRLLNCRSHKIRIKKSRDNAASKWGLDFELYRSLRAYLLQLFSLARSYSQIKLVISSFSNAFYPQQKKKKFNRRDFTGHLLLVCYIASFPSSSGKVKVKTFVVDSIFWGTIAIGSILSRVFVLPVSLELSLPISLPYFKYMMVVPSTYY